MTSLGVAVRFLNNQARAGLGEMWGGRKRGAIAAAVLAMLLATAGGASAQELIRLDRAWPVMGTLFRATAFAPDTMLAQRALGAAREQVFRVDSLMSTWKPESELSRLNAAAGDGRWMPLSPETIEVLAAALYWAEHSDGAFDPTVGPLVGAWGFHGGEERVPLDAEIDSLRELVDWREVEFEPNRPSTRPSYGADESSGAHGPAPVARVRLARPGMALDLGAIAQGYALDRAIQSMADAGAWAGRVDLGGQVSVFGPAPDGADGWPLGITDPRNPKEVLGRVSLDGGSIATSGDYQQFFEVDGNRYHHIIDPRDGWPVEGLAQVTVIADGGMDADALSTTLFVLGPELGRAFIERWAPEATVIWIRTPDDEEVDEADIVVGGAGSELVEIEDP